MDNEKPLNALAAEINEINRANGWNVVTPESWKEPYHIPAILALIHSGVSEALEGFRHSDRENVADELTDTLHRVLDMMGGLEIDIDARLQKIMTQNRKRGYKHGGKRI